MEKCNPAMEKERMMDKFGEFLKTYHAKHMHERVAYTSDELHIASSFWQEATKQRDAQYELMAEHTELSIREDAIIGERKRIVSALQNRLIEDIGLTSEAADALAEYIDSI